MPARGLYHKMSENMVNIEDLTFSQLELCSYRYLQQVAKSMKVPCNVKKVYLIEMIRAKKYSNAAALEAIIERIKLERQQQALKKPRRKNKKAQGTEISSTNTIHSPPVTRTPKRSPHYMIPYPLPVKDTRMSILHPTISKKAIHSDRVLRSCNMRMRPNYSILNVNSSVLGMIRSRSGLFRSQEDGEYPHSIFQRQQFVRTYPPRQRAIQDRTSSDDGRQLVPVVRSINTPTLRPAKRQRQLSGIYPLNTEERYYRYSPTVNIRRQDGSVSKINALVYRPNEKPMERVSTTKELIPLEDVPDLSTVKSDDVNSSTESANSNIERQILAENAERFEEPEVFSRHTQTGPYKTVKLQERSREPENLAYTKNQIGKMKPVYYADNLNYEPEVQIHTQSQSGAASDLDYKDDDPIDCRYTGNQNDKERQMRFSENQIETERQMRYTENQIESERQMRFSENEMETERQMRYTENQNEIERQMRYTENQIETERHIRYPENKNDTERQMRYTDNQNETGRHIQYLENQNETERQMRDTDNQTETERQMRYTDYQNETERQMGYTENQNETEHKIRYPENQNETERQMRYTDNQNETERQMRFSENQIETESQMGYTENLHNEPERFHHTENQYIRNICYSGNYNPKDYHYYTQNHQKNYDDINDSNSVNNNYYTENQNYPNRYTEDHNYQRNKYTDVNQDSRNMQSKEDYPNMSALTDVYPDNHTNTELSSNSRGTFSVYCHKRRAEQGRPLRDSIQEVRAEKRLPRIVDAFTQFNDTQYRQYTQPLYVEVSQDSEGSQGSGSGVVLEALYTWRQAARPRPRARTRCVYSTPIITTAVPQRSIALGPQYESFPLPNQYSYNMESEAVPRLYDYAKMAEQERRNLTCDEVLSTTDSLESYTSQELGANVTIPDMVDDAMELISQDGDYMERIGKDLMPCIACSAWAGPTNMLEYHIRKEHSIIINPVDSEWCVQFPLASVWRAPAHRVSRRRRLYVLTAAPARPHSLSLRLCTLQTMAEDTPKYCRLSMYQKSTNNPFIWEGEITQLNNYTPYHDTGLKMDINSLKILPSNVILVDDKLVYEYNGREILEEELSGVYVTVFVKVFD